MQTADFDFSLPRELIAQTPAPQRDKSRLLVLRREDGTVRDQSFCDFLNLLRTGDVLVLNDSRVIPARLRGANARTGGRFEILLIEEDAANEWQAMLCPAKRARAGTEITLRSPNGKFASLKAKVIGRNGEGHHLLRFSGTASIGETLKEIGEAPLPPYIHRKASDGFGEDHERYQTVFARLDGSVAAPTAGLHFTRPLLEGIRARGVKVSFITLHVGPATFTPVKSETVEAHRMHGERYEVSGETASEINRAKRDGRRVIAVGTTTVRVLESVAAANSGQIVPGAGRTRIFIHPPFDFKIVDALLTNFHLPRSTLLMLVSAFAAPGETRGRELVLSAYAEAVRRRYRFFSYGDAMLIL